ncbi:MAG: ATP-binding protein [Phycisphaerae bacterium]
MKPLQVNVKSNPEDLTVVREALRNWLATQEWNDIQVAEIVLAVDEALTNVIRHGYDGKPDMPIEFQAERFVDSHQGAGIEINVRDYGKQVDLSKICGRDLNDIRPGGLGVHLIHAMMSYAAFKHADGGGMRLVMRKYLTHFAKTSES